MSNEATQALTRISTYRQHIREAEVNTAAEVAVARANGATWEAIADALGVTRQAAHKTYGPSGSAWA